MGRKVCLVPVWFNIKKWELCCFQFSGFLLVFLHPKMQDNPLLFTDVTNWDVYQCLLHCAHVKSF